MTNGPVKTNLPHKLVLCLPEYGGARAHMERLHKLVAPHFHVELIDLPRVEQEIFGTEVPKKKSLLRGVIWKTLRGLAPFLFLFVPRRAVVNLLLRGARDGLLTRVNLFVCKRVPYLSELAREFQLLRHLSDSFDLGDPSTLLILPEENILGKGAIWGFFFRRMSGKTVVFNYTSGVEAEWLESAQREVRHFHPLWLFPSFKSFSRNTATGVVHMRPRAYVLSFLLGLQVERPWSGYLGLADAYLVDSEEEVRKLGFLGAPVHLVEPAEMVLALDLALGLEAENRFSGLGILIPPNQWEGEEGEQKFIKFLGDLDGLLGKIAGRTKFYFSLHPRLGKSNQVVSALVARYGNRVFGLEEVLARSSAILQFGSAAHRIASQLNLSVVDVDVFGYGALDGVPVNPRHKVTRAKSFLEASAVLEKLYSSETAEKLEVLKVSWKGLEAISGVIWSDSKC